MTLVAFPAPARPKHPPCRRRRSVNARHATAHHAQIAAARSRPAVRVDDVVGRPEHAGRDAAQPAEPQARPQARRPARQAGDGDGAAAQRRQAPLQRLRLALQRRRAPRPLLRLPGDGESLALVPDAHVRLPDLPGPDGPGDRQEGVRGPRHRQVRVQDSSAPTASGCTACSTARATTTSSRGCSSTRASTGTSSTPTAGTSSLLVDSQSAHDAAPACESLPYIEHGAETAPDTDCVSDWRFSREVRSGKVVLTSYDFERPRPTSRSNAVKERSYTMSDYEVFDFQGDYIQNERRQAVGRRPHRRTADAVPGAARRVERAGHRGRPPAQAHQASARRPERAVPDHRAAGQRAASTPTSRATRRASFRCDFSAIPAAQQFRPPRRTPKPFVQGPQTAVVVGPGGEEIFTDKYGRVKVQFHWDRYGKKNEKSSCWVRVSHPWAGKNFGVDAHPAHRPGGGRRLPRRRPGPADDHRPRLQRGADAAVGPAGERDAVGHPDAVEQGRRRTATPTRSASRTRRAASRSGSMPRRTRTSRSRTTRRTGSGTTARRRSTTTRRRMSSTTARRRSTTTRRSRSTGSHGDGRQERDDHDPSEPDRDGRHERDHHDRRQPHRERRRERDDHDRREPHRSRWARARRRRWRCSGRIPWASTRRSRSARRRRSRSARCRASRSAPTRRSSVGANQTNTIGAKQTDHGGCQRRTTRSAPIAS